jgi:hypothetical protein
MIQKVNRKTLEEMRDGIGEISRKFGQLEFRRPWVYHRSMAERQPWAWISVALFSILTASIVYFYRRKRQQVADSYNMGEGSEAWQATPDPGSDRMGIADRHNQAFRSP